MIEEQMVVGVVLEQRQLTGKWGGTAWRPVTIFTTPPEVAPWTSLGNSAGVARYYAGAVSIRLFSTDTTNYRDNLASGSPKLWVVMRMGGADQPVEILLLTADPAEGEGSTEAGNNIVETIDMPAEVGGAIAAFIEAHHVERPIIKRRRDGQAPDVRWRDRPPGDALRDDKWRGEKS